MSVEVLALPERMARLPLDARGYPIFYTAYVDAQGVPNFRALEPERVNRCLKDRLCGMCGQRLEGNSFCLVTDRPNLESLRRMTDAPMHEECLRYALQVCPYLSRPQARRSGAPPAADTQMYVNVARTKPAEVLMVWCRSYDKRWRPEIEGYVFAKPYRVEVVS